MENIRLGVVTGRTQAVNPDLYYIVSDKCTECVGSTTSLSAPQYAPLIAAWTTLYRESKKTCWPRRSCTCKKTSRPAFNSDEDALHAWIGHGRWPAFFLPCGLKRLNWPVCIGHAGLRAAGNETDRLALHAQLETLWIEALEAGSILSELVRMERGLG